MMSRPVNVYQDAQRQAQWSFVCVDYDRKRVDQTLAGIELYLDTALDAGITRIDFQEL